MRPFAACAFAVNSSHPVAVGILGATLDAGESEAIAMSQEWPADLLIMDESSGTAKARNLNIRITDPQTTPQNPNPSLAKCRSSPISRPWKRQPLKNV